MYEDEMEDYEFESEYEYEDDELEMEADDGESPFDPETELELAAELLEVEDEAELEQFLGSLISGAARLAGRAIRSPVGQRILGHVKGLAKRALPAAGAAAGRWLGGHAGGYLGGRAGGYLGGRYGGPVGRRLGSWGGRQAGRWAGRQLGQAGGRWAGQKIGRYFGLELEGLSPDVAEFEVAKKIVRLTGTAAKKAALSARPESPAKKAARAVKSAARRHCPGLAKKLYSPPLRPRPFTVGR